MPSKKTINSDMIIVGAGAAGLAAAVAAAENNVSNIVILEKRPVIGGNAVFVMGMFAAQSTLQQRLGIEADKDLLFRKAMAYAHWRIDPRLIRALINKSGDTIQWLQNHGLEIDRLHPMYPNQVPMVFHFHKAPGNMGRRYVKAFSAQCDRSNINTCLHCAAKRLLVSAEGDIKGVIVETGDGEVQVNAPAVVLSKGGYLGNPELIRTYLPTYRPEEFHLAGIPHQGDGTQMALDADAALDGMAVLEMNGPMVPHSNCLSVVAHHPATLWINRNGERFTDESLVLFPETANCLYRQLGRQAYTLFDETQKRRIATSIPNPLDAMSVANGDWPEMIDKELLAHTAPGQVLIAADLSDIAGFVGVHPDILMREIDIYNDFCDKGYDPLFGKHRKHLQPLRTPPFYAVRTGIKVMTTHGGPKVNADMAILNTKDRPIPGLFAAGVETGCTDAGTYDGHLTGHSFGFSVVSGRIAGESAAKYIKEHHRRR